MYGIKGFSNRDLSEDVALYGEQETVRFHLHLRRGRQKGQGGQFRLPHGIDHAGLRRSAGLQSDPDWRAFGFERLRNRDP